MSLFEQLKSVGLKQRIRARLKQAILEGSLEPGQQLVEVEIARQFGVSRSPVREVIQELERQGYVVKKLRRGTFVTELTPQAVTEIYSLLCDSTGHSQLIYLSQCLNTEMGFHKVLARYSPAEVDNVIRAHWALVEAIEIGEPEIARRTIQQHIRMAGHLFLQKFFDQDGLSVSEQEEERMEEFWKAVE